MKLSPRATVRQAYAAITQDCVSQIIAFEEGAKNRQPESLHKMRVGVRRLRSVMNLFKPAIVAEQIDDLTRDLRWLQRVLGTARDWDVFIDRTVVPLQAATTVQHEKDDLAVLLAACKSRHRLAYDGVISALNGHRYRSLRENVQNIIADEQHGNGDTTKPEWRDDPSGDFANHVLRKRAKKVIKLGRDINSRRLPELHELRKQCKKLRYGIEFFANFYPGKPVRRHIKHLTVIQDTIGFITDVGAGHDMLKTLHSKKKLNKGSINRARHLVIGWMLGRSFDYHNNLNQIWKTFADYVDEKPVWK